MIYIMADFFSFFYHLNVLFVCLVLGKEEALYHFLIAKKKMATEKVQLLPFNSCLNRWNIKIRLPPCFSNKFTYDLIPGWSNKPISLSFNLSLYFPFCSYLVVFSISSCHTRTRHLRCPPSPTAVPHLPLIRGEHRSHFPADGSKYNSSSEFQYCLNALENTTGCSAQQKGFAARKRRWG